MLSERAKGKQRATDSAPLPQEDSSRARELTVRFTEGEPDLILQIAENETVRDVKANIRKCRHNLKQRRLRLIHSGRLLSDGTILYAWLTSLEERQARSANEKSSSASSTSLAVKPSTPSMITWLHCSAGAVLPEGEEEDESPQAPPQLPQLRGFDRLRTAGFTDEDIANMRRQFHLQNSGSYLDSALADEGDYDEHARALEEQWIDDMSGNGTANVADSHATSSSILQGVILGFFFPLIPIYFFFETKPAAFWDNGREHDAVPSVIFSRRMQMGIVLGFNLNLLFGIWRYVLGSTL